MTKGSRRLATWMALALSVLFLSGCASNPADPNDPLEPVNRDFHAINDHLDSEIVKPIAETYIDYVPEGMRQGVSNFFDNLGEPGNMVNDLLQGKFEDALTDAGRFVANSTMGVGGLFDIATNMGMERNDEDFGQTLGVWGADEGAYLVIPGRGPNSLRDIWDIPVSILTNPLTYVDLGIVSIPLGAIAALDSRARLDGVIDIVNTSALDPYIFVREAYRQRRVDRIYDGNPPDDLFDKLDQATADAFQP